MTHNMAPKGIINFADVNLPKAGMQVRYGHSKAVYPKYSLSLGKYSPCNSDGAEIWRKWVARLFPPSWISQDGTPPSISNL
jgi:hypothetical protein